MDFLRGHGLKFTPSRRSILREVFAAHDHFDVETLHDRLKKRGERVSVATIYRLMPILIESGLVRPAIQSGHHLTYEHVFGHRCHHHMVCDRCGKIIEFEDREIEKRLYGICKDNQFAPAGHRISVRGICAECRKEEDK